MKLEMRKKDIRKIVISNFMKILSVGAELYRADGQTDTTKLTDAFLNFVQESKNRFRQDIPISVEIYDKVHGLPSKFGNYRLQKGFFSDGLSPLGRYVLLIDKYLSTFRRTILPLY
jgi:hypothetical protein